MIFVVLLGVIASHSCCKQGQPNHERNDRRYCRVSYNFGLKGDFVAEAREAIHRHEIQLCQAFDVDNQFQELRRPFCTKDKEHKSWGLAKINVPDSGQRIERNSEIQRNTVRTQSGQKFDYPDVEFWPASDAKHLKDVHRSHTMVKDPRT